MRCGAGSARGPGWWVWVVIGWCSLLIWYGVWLRSLIRDSSSQRETRLSITTGIPLARAKWDGSKGRGKWWRKGGDNSEKGWKWRRKDNRSVSMGQWRREWGQRGRESPRKLSTEDQKYIHLFFKSSHYTMNAVSNLTRSQMGKLKTMWAPPPQLQRITVARTQSSIYRVSFRKPPTAFQIAKPLLAKPV